MKIIIYAIFISSFWSCSNNTNELKNPKAGELKKIKTLKQINIKEFSLDSITAPNPAYIQIYKDSVNDLNLTFLNSYNNSIYFYNYRDLSLIKKVSFPKEGPNGILKPAGYFIKNLDSIYIYNRALLEIIIANDNSEISNKISLIGNEKFNDLNWIRNYPQYDPKTVIPILRINNNLYFTGFYADFIPDELIKDSKHTAIINMKTNIIDFTHTYPKELYGNYYNWGDSFFNKVYPIYNTNKKALIYSYPVSHFVYQQDLSTNKTSKIYAGSNFARTITSFNDPATTKRRVPRNKINLKLNQQDFYGGILHDKWRRLYYRFTLKAIPNATIKTNYKKKKVAVIIMDEDYNYLGETVLGAWRNWNWENSFVTEDGLNIEYLDHHNLDEISLTFKIFQPKDI
ncbi:DUF4221 family protein [Algibacter sp. R77976]|uniref:DUF4221 family protein n=1 Tax=Algibacter sp. R77976 TaxID=3093873 RepID=UPI0037CA2193